MRWRISLVVGLLVMLATPAWAQDAPDDADTEIVEYVTAAAYLPEPDQLPAEIVSADDTPQLDPLRGARVLDHYVVDGLRSVTPVSLGIELYTGNSEQDARPVVPPALVRDLERLGYYPTVLPDALAESGRAFRDGEWVMAITRRGSVRTVASWQDPGDGSVWPHVLTLLQLVDAQVVARPHPVVPPSLAIFRMPPVDAATAAPHAIAANTSVATGGSTGRPVPVRGYTRRDGTYVSSYYRTAPDSTTQNNYSTRGNVNPFTNQTGTRSPSAPGRGGRGR